MKGIGLIGKVINIYNIEDLNNEKGLNKILYLKIQENVNLLVFLQIKGQNKATKDIKASNNEAEANVCKDKSLPNYKNDF